MLLSPAVALLAMALGAPSELIFDFGMRSPSTPGPLVTLGQRFAAILAERPKPCKTACTGHEQATHE